MLFELSVPWNGKNLILRNAEDVDAEQMIEYLKVTSTESRYLVSEFDEINITIEDEIKFINMKKESPRDILLIGIMDGRHIGNGSINSYGTKKRYYHRCSLGIALYHEYCNKGLGSIMVEILLQIAKNMGYEQVELEVVTTNVNAIHLYEKYGFKKEGTLTNNMKYQDGTYADVYIMVKNL